MKIELDLTEEQLDLLLDLVFSKFDELDKQEDSLLICRDFSMDWDEIAKYEKELEELDKTLKPAENLYQQVRKHKYPYLPVANYP